MRGSVVCLDQCAWIALSNIRNGEHPFNNNKPSESNHKRLFRNVVELYKRQDTFFPITFERQIETLKPESPERRIELAKFMVALSSCMTLGPNDERLLMREIHNYLVDNHHLPNKKYIFPYTIMNVGLLGLLDGHIESKKGKDDVLSPEERADIQKVNDYMKSPECMVKVLSDTFDESVNIRDPFIKDVKKDLESDAKKNFDALRRDLENNRELGRSWQEYRNIRSRDFFVDTIIPVTISVFKELGFNENNLLPESEKMWSTWDEFYANIPSAYITSKLVDERDRRRCRVDDPNDYLDVSFLAYAIPYGSVVVTDEKWAEISRFQKLDEQFDTKILSVSEFVNSANIEDISNYSLNR
jgi:hypothetical protein